MCALHTHLPRLQNMLRKYFFSPHSSFIYSHHHQRHFFGASPIWFSHYFVLFIYFYVRMDLVFH